jgi:peptide/nickel transport system ATP-binding protein
MPLLSVRDLAVHFPVTKGVLWQHRTGAVRAVDGVSFDLHRGQTLGLVGESGSGKSSTGRALVQLNAPSAGSVKFEGRELLGSTSEPAADLRRRVQMIFQDPYSSLNPRLRVDAIIGEALDARGFPRGARRRERIAELMALVGLPPEYARRFPHEFSGGQRQRIGIARALAVEPDFIVADEPVSALDVSVQAQVLNLMSELQQRLSLTMLFIAHDLSVVEYLCDDVVVMYLGRVMERGPSREVYAAPRHPYTRALLATAPVPDPKRKRTHVPLQGDIPSPIDPPSGCVFRTRCPLAIEACAQVVPPVEHLGNDHHVACIRHGELAV